MTKKIEKVLERYKRAFHRYGDHTRWCPTRKNAEQQCACGFAAEFNSIQGYEGDEDEINN